MDGDCSSQYVCKLCQKAFNRKKGLCRHERLVHKILATKTGTFHCLQHSCESAYTTLDEIHNHITQIHQLPKSSYEKTCVICYKAFSQKSHLYEHLRKIHKVETRTGTLFCPEDGCEFTFPNLAGIRTHLAKRHQATNVLQKTEIAFQTAEDFTSWKIQEERETCSLFVSQSGLRPIPKTNVKKQFYYCNRSGKYQPTGTGQIRMKSQGSCKTGKCCPAAMEAEWYPDGSVKVLYWSGHYGHKKELTHIHLSAIERAEIAEKLAQGMTFDAILDEVRSSVSGPLERIHLLSRKDLHSIRNSFDLCAIEQNNDHHVVEVEMYEHPISTEDMEMFIATNEETNTVDPSINYETTTENRTQSVQRTFNCCLKRIESGAVEDAKILQLEMFMKKWLAE